MMTRISRIVFLIFGLCLACCSYVNATPLDDYVFAPDPNYGYELLKTYNMEGYTMYVYNFTSQKWFDESVSNQPLWWHFLCITVPDNLTVLDAGFMLIDGGSNNKDNMPTPTENPTELTVMFAVSTGAIGACLKQVPNEPIIFKADPTHQNRDEDAIIAWTWREFILNQSNPYILLRMPMTKAAVRAMDAITEIAAQKSAARIKKFMIAGASKRGWTTWTTAAVDNKRVFAAIPMVMDLLNLNENMHHHYRSLGGWTFAFNDYYVMNITGYLDTPALVAMQKIIDPFYYFDRYVNTKILVVNSLGDEFFIPDDSDYFWGNLVAATNGSVMSRRLPNAEHSMAGHELSLFLSMRSFFLSVYYNQRLPRMTWTRPNNATHGIIVVTVDTVNGPTPTDAIVYFAQTLDNKRRDFRLFVGSPNNPNKPVIHPVLWDSNRKIIETEVTSTSIIYTVALPIPFSGWLGFVVQVSFPGLQDSVLQISTQVNIVPETFPFPDCFQESCRGTLV